jgi:hypothetical protein
MPELPNQTSMAQAAPAGLSPSVVQSHPMPAYMAQVPSPSEPASPVAAAQSVAAGGAEPDHAIHQVSSAGETPAGQSDAPDENAIQHVDQEAIGNVESFHNREATQRRSFVDLTAQPWFKHSADYSTLEGQVTYSHIDKAWRLRFASLDDIDSLGGSVTLVDNPAIQGLKDGQHIQVQGRLVDPDRHEAGSAYKVQSLQCMDH